ncbi:MAG TPA: hypothetical protein VF516_12415 [Kofleriaceae bacterium]
MGASKPKPVSDEPTIKLSAKQPKPGTPERGDGPLALRMMQGDDVQYLLLVVAPREDARVRGSGARYVAAQMIAMEGMADDADRRDAEALYERAQRRRINGANPPPQQPMMDWE